MSEVVQLFGEVTIANHLLISRARACAEFVTNGMHPFATVVEYRRRVDPPALETIVLDLQVECPQVVTHDIRSAERIAVVFSPDGDGAPQVLALSNNFPRVPHLNLQPADAPPSLCLYEEPWAEIELTWTPATFIERIRWWLAQTARGSLHGADQPLEPLLPDSGLHLVLPADTLSSDASSGMSERLTVTVRAAKCPRVLVAERQRAAAELGAAGLDYVATVFRTKPQQHGIIHHQPRTLAELSDFTSPARLNLLADLRARLTCWRNDPRALQARLVIIIFFPKMRDSQEKVEAEDVWAFMTAATVAEIGQEIGCFLPGMSDVGGRDSVFPLIPHDTTKRGEEVRLDVLRPHLALNRTSAARFSGYEGADDRNIAAVGVGALGSQVFLNLAREGYGQWTLIDDDYLLPHNVVRHGLPGYAVGHTKAEALEHLVNGSLDDDQGARALPVNVQRPGADSEILGEALAKADVILDMSASVPVARHLALDVATDGRRISLFLNPSGTDLVVLCEDEARRCGLDALEMQYYREVATRKELQCHLRSLGSRARYARSCRDLTSAIPQSRVAVLAGIASQAIRMMLGSTEAEIGIWRMCPETFEVRRTDVPISEPQRQSIGQWTVCSDRALLVRLAQVRADKLPRETGGVLLGAFDLKRRIVYIIDTLPSPPDSIEYPTLYVRGADGLAEGVKLAETRTGGNLRYVGEWHSHPDRCSCSPSVDDKKVFGWLADNMAQEGVPAVMAIVGRADLRFFVGDIATTAETTQPAEA